VDVPALRHEACISLERSELGTLQAYARAQVSPRVTSSTSGYSD